MLLGMADIWVFLAFAGCIFSALVCAVYGLLKWNTNGGEITPEDLAWAKEEDALTEEL